ncbi:MAG: hypothetical protein KJN84_06180 [Bacteroidia bacterium]|nr:hypothetical protein [Bacteroidia bacterium]
MKNKPDSLNRTLSWNTKFFFLLAFVLVTVGFIFQDTEMGISLGAILALLAVLIIDYYKILSVRFPKTWRAIKFIVVVLIIALTLISFLQ